MGFFGDLWEAIEQGQFPEWELGFQLFTEEQAESFSFDILDSTKLVPEELVPVTPVVARIVRRLDLITAGRKLMPLRGGLPKSKSKPQR